jgi:hypothetical protein
MNKIALYLEKLGAIASKIKGRACIQSLNLRQSAWLYYWVTMVLPSITKLFYPFQPVMPQITWQHQHNKFLS